MTMMIHLKLTTKSVHVYQHGIITITANSLCFSNLRLSNRLIENKELHTPIALQLDSIYILISLWYFIFI